MDENLCPLQNTAKAVLASESGLNGSNHTAIGEPSHQHPIFTGPIQCLVKLYRLVVGVEDDRHEANVQLTGQSFVEANLLLTHVSASVAICEVRKACIASVNFL